MLTVYGRPSSINVQKVLWLVAELGLEHQHVPRGGSFGGLDTPEFRALNPHGKVPVIDDGGVAVWESNAILRYLAARFGGEQWWPTGPAERARIEPWMDWEVAKLQPDCTSGIFWGYYRTPEAQRDWAAIRRALKRTADDLHVLDDILATRPYLAGEHFSLADIPAGTQLFRYFTLDIERPEVPHVVAWYTRLQERPGYRTHVMRPYEELRGRLAF